MWNSILDVSQSVYLIPRSHWHCDFHGFDWTGHESKKKALLDYLDRISVEPGNLVMIGPPGTGKTHISVALYRWAVLRYGAGRSMWVNVPDFCMQVKRGFDSNDDPFELVERAQYMLVLDDLYGREMSPWELDNVLYRLIDTAYRNAAHLVVTTNYTVDELEQRVNAHELSRIMNNAEIWAFKGEDKRL